ncbi:hypothetical protein M4D55_13205 [Metabacillus idriensis]|uniref:Uncharacterized protein n=1 Tax=Metabacillus idriensis TaxID=324768 RepID=A0A6I2MF77_9BACI|nr:hypothetical protein [Metabacillus idriensis]MCM3596723.1 hypothetical protein [Metabacillus idriensis]MRX56449.1 hypothetical protein [Metabacillus idriensis]OHR72690.1 hypothetical protein HMPREF3291_06080 [Bacillus sp. HMSC76G11]
MTITFEETTQLEVQAVKALYDDVEWSAFTRDMPRLMEAIKCSLKIITACIFRLLVVYRFINIFDLGYK